MKIFIAFSIEVFLVRCMISFHFINLRLSLSASCFHTMHFDDEIITWKPTCEIDGSYSAKQCRGDKLTGRLVCFSIN